MHTNSGNLQNVQTWISRLIVALILALTVASVANIHDAAAMQHAGQSWIVPWAIALGFGGALAVTTYLVMIVTWQKARTVGIGVAAVFVLVSGSIQTSVYLHAGAAGVVAFAFGFGVPLGEVLLAIMDSMLRIDIARSAEGAAVHTADPAQKTPAEGATGAAVAPQKPPQYRTATAVQKPAEGPQKPAADPAQLQGAAVQKAKPPAVQLQGLNSTQSAIIAALSNGMQGTATAAELADHLQVNNATIYRNLPALEAAGRVTRAEGRVILAQGA